MANNYFEWTRTDEDSSPKEEALTPSTRPNIAAKFIQDNKILIGLVVFILTVGAVSSTSKPKSPKKTAAQPPITGYVSMWPLKKGEAIEPSLLKAIALSAGSLTKTQRLRIFDADQFNVSGLAVKAKKDIAPNTPLFWTDLTLQKEVQTLTQKQSEIFYGLSPERKSK